MIASALSSRAEQLSLQPLYARPPPIWLHPTFAAEFADPFIADTPFEESAMHVSLEVLTLSLDRLLEAGGGGHDLSHAARSALNTAGEQLKEARKLAHKLANARKGQGQDRAFFAAVSSSLGELEPGGVLLIPWDGECPVLLVIRRGGVPHQDTCTFTVVNPSVAAIPYHATDGQAPPKLKLRTCLELGGVPLARLRDEAWWVTLWFGMNINLTEVASGKLKRSPLKVLYEVLLPFLSGASLDRSIAQWEAEAVQQGLPPLPYRTPRRSNTGHYGCCRHALRYLLLRAGVDEDECRRASLLLRLQMLRLAQHDLRFVNQLGDAERSVLHLARRSLAYKAAKLGQLGLISLERLGGVRRAVEEMDEAARAIAGDIHGHDAAPPPLILCADDAHLGRPSLELLLGSAGLLPPVGGAVRAAEELLEGVEVVGFYFAASWCAACGQTTALLAQAYTALRARGKRLELVLVPQDTDEAGLDECRGAMPWPSLALGSGLPAYLGQRYGVSSIPTLVLLSRAGDLISTDGVRLLRRHGRSFPWTAMAPPQTPHLHPLCERLLRLGPVDPGQSHDLPKYKPLDFLMQPAAATSLAEAVAALRECDLLCTQTAVQSHSVLNTPFLKIALVQHTFSCVLPMPKPEGDQVGAVFPWQCLWRTPMLYDQQLGLLLLLQRIAEHFAASALSVDHTHSLDGVRMVVAACIACIADCVMRQIATDKPSRVCVHLRGTHERRGFTIGSAELAKQSGAVPVHTPELNTARTCALDYFAAQAGSALLTRAVLTVAILAVAVLTMAILAALRRRRACLYLLTRAVLTRAVLTVSILTLLPLRRRRACRRYMHGREVTRSRSTLSGGRPTYYATYLLLTTCYLLEARTGLRWVRQIAQDLPLILTLTLILTRWVRQIAQDLAFPADVANVAQYIRDNDALLIKNFPEFRCYRDIAFYLKFFLNPQRSAFPPKASYSQRQAQLSFYFHQASFNPNPNPNPNSYPNPNPNPTPKPGPPSASTRRPFTWEVTAREASHNYCPPSHG